MHLEDKQGQRKEEHHRQEGEGVASRQAPAVPLQDDDEGDAHQHEENRREAVALQEDARQAPVPAHAGHQAADPDVGREDGRRQDDEGVDGDPDLQPLPRRQPAQVGERPVPVLHELGQVRGEDALQDERDVQEGHRVPHVPQRLGEDARLLLLDEVRGALEAADAQHRVREPEDDLLRHGLRVPREVQVGPEVRGHLREGHADRGQGDGQEVHDDEHRHREHVEDEHARGDARRLANSNNL
mmetsp:Transcript_40256/g.113839  ORF Transcript_40256/g.113839 Transcript_40256/m.113839 type:complete len:242 (+) Transcript_40256:930-1655(+)